ncbi:MAG: DotA/TraY family protein [Bdellovibrionales bacterium]
MSGLKATSVLHYAFMPEVVPRLKLLFASGFGYIAFLMAQIYGMVRLLPPNHPYLNPQNIGLFGIRHVIAEAANHLVIKRENIDQLLIFIILFAGIVLLLSQIVLIAFGLIFGVAEAAPILDPGTSLFVTANPTADIAFMLLDQVFGIPGLYGSCIASSAPCPGTVSPTPAGSFPWPFHIALHEMFRFYSTGMLIVGTMIFLYFIVIVVGETATTGSPFGQRFQNIWVPIRLVVAVGLLVPINHGLNSGQYITLFVAKYGSSFATNGWLRYNNAIAENALFSGGGANPTGEKESLIGYPEPKDISPITQTMSLVHTCAISYWMRDQQVHTDKPMPPSDGFYIRPYLVKQPTERMENKEKKKPFTMGTTYKEAVEFFNKGDIVIRFGRDGDADGDGQPDYEQAGNYEANVVPLCGDVRISIKDISSIIGSSSTTPVGPEAIQEYYFETIKQMWFSDSQFTDFAGRYASLILNESAIDPCDFGSGNEFLPPNTPPGSNCANGKITGDWKQGIINKYQAETNAKLKTIWTNYINETQEIAMTKEILERGWGGAGIWFNKIATLNGDYMDANSVMPVLVKMPLVMETVREERRKQDAASSGLDEFNPNLSNGKKIELSSDDNRAIARVLNDVFVYWNKDGQNQDNTEKELNDSALEAGINFIFGTEGLFSMTDKNNHVHPLAQLAMLGKGLVEASIRNVATATIGSAIGGLSLAFDNIPAAIIEPFSSFILSTAFVGLTAGLVLYYILPFLPFLYFYFAVGGWVKTIFEAMVGVPLWALAHLRLDGEGLPGNSAANGYFLLFEIFVRPILSVFGLVAAILIFTGQVRVLNFIWQLVTENLAGYDNDPTITVASTSKTISKVKFDRTVVDQFFFTIIYAIIVYMMAIASFKLIDKIPDNILRWMGGSVSSFSDINQDATEGLTRYAALGGMTAGQTLAGGVKDLGGNAGKLIGQAGNQFGTAAGQAALKGSS